MFAKINYIEEAQEHNATDKLRKKEKWEELSCKYSHYDFCKHNYWETKLYRYKLCESLLKRPGRSRHSTVHFYVVRETKKSKRKL